MAKPVMETDFDSNHAELCSQAEGSMDDYSSSSASLKELYLHRSGKVSDRWELYLEVYDQLFASRRNKPVRVLEIGVQNGGSLECWTQYFPNLSILVGIDIDTSCNGLSFANAAVNIIIGDASAPEISRQACSLSINYDIIIDDGSHKSSDIIKCFFNYFKVLEHGGIYVAEDLHCAYWDTFEGGLNERMSSIAFFKRLVDIINRSHWGISNISALEALRPFCDHYGIPLNQSDLDWLCEIKSVSFEDSMCIITKRSCRFGEPLLGRRLISGTEEAVITGHDELQFEFCGCPNQDHNFCGFSEDTSSFKDQARIKELQAIVECKLSENHSLCKELSVLRQNEDDIRVYKSEISHYYSLLREAQKSEARTASKLAWNRAMLKHFRKISRLQSRYERRLRDLYLRFFSADN
jgi:hypothetical protein